MEHYITEIDIENLRHLSDIRIQLNSECRQHLMLTGKNGSGKTSLLLAIRKYLQAVNDGKLNELSDHYIPSMNNAVNRIKNAKTENQKFEAEKSYQTWQRSVEKYKDGINIIWNESKDLDAWYAKGNFITAFFPADRKTEIIRAHGVEDVKLKEFYDINADPARLLIKYMVHLKTQQAYAKNEGDVQTADRIQKWFDRFTGAMRILLDDPSITLEYDYKEYNFKIHEDGRNPFGFDELSDGYSSVIHIVSDLILRMDKNWLLGNSLSEYTVEGVVLIDELETHLHIELQKKIMPFLTEFFPRIQFIITTHSPYILNSVSNARAYDLENCVEMENLSVYSADGLAEGYFGADEYSDELKKKIERYQFLKEKNSLTDDERAQRAELRHELKNIPQGMAPEAKEKFEDIEGKRL